MLARIARGAVIAAVTTGSFACDPTSTVVDSGHDAVTGENGGPNGAAPGPLGSRPAGGATGGTVFYTFASHLVALDLASGRETSTSFSSQSDETIGIGAGLITDIDRTDVLSQDAWINLRQYKNGVFQIVGKVDLADVTYDEAGVARPSPDGSLFLMTTRDLNENGLQLGSRVRVLDRGGRTVGQLESYSNAVWLSADRAIIVGDDGLFVATVGAKGISQPLRIGNVGLGTPGRAPGQPAVSPDGTMITFVHGDAIWRIGVDGSNLTQVTRQSVLQQSNPVFSPDGSTIVVQYGDCRVAASAKEVPVPAIPAGAPADPFGMEPLRKVYEPIPTGNRVTISACGPVYWLP